MSDPKLAPNLERVDWSSTWARDEEGELLLEWMRLANLKATGEDVDLEATFWSPDQLEAALEGAGPDPERRLVVLRLFRWGRSFLRWRRWQVEACEALRAPWGEGSLPFAWPSTDQRWRSPLLPVVVPSDWQGEDLLGVSDRARPGGVVVVPVEEVAALVGRTVAERPAAVGPRAVVAAVQPVGVAAPVEAEVPQGSVGETAGVEAVEDVPVPLSPRLRALAGLIGDAPQACPVCDEFDCTHRFYGAGHYRFGDPMGKWERLRGGEPRTIPAPHRIVDEELERVVFGPGDLMTESEARKYGVLPAVPGRSSGSPRRKGHRQ